MSYFAWNWSKSLCVVVVWYGVCKSIIVFNLAQAEQNETVILDFRGPPPNFELFSTYF